VDVWLWDAAGPGEHSGITDTEARARTDAEALLAKGKAATARVELAHAHLGGPWIHSGYERTGAGLTAARTSDGTVTWTPFHRPAPPAS
jgi:hypothetical protein